MNTPELDSTWTAVLDSVTDEWARSQRGARLRRLLFLSWAASLVLGIVGLYIILQKQQRDALQAIRQQEISSKTAVANLVLQDSLISELIRQMELRWSTSLQGKADSAAIWAAVNAKISEAEFGRQIALRASQRDLNDVITSEIPRQLTTVVSHFDTVTRSLGERVDKKADVGFVTDALSQKVDVQTFNRGIGARVTTEVFEEAIAGIREDVDTRVSERDLVARLRDFVTDAQLEGYVTEAELGQRLERLRGDSTEVVRRQ